MYEDIEWATNATEDSNKRKNEQFLLKNEQRISDQLVKRQNWYQMPIYGLVWVGKLSSKSCSTWGSYGNSMGKVVLNTAIIVSSSSNQMLKSLKTIAPITAAKNPLQ